VSGLLERLGVERPVFQAGMGGGISGGRLAGAVSVAGGLGTIGLSDPGGMRRELAAARAATDRPVAANLLLPFARRGHWEAVEAADVVVTFWGEPERRTSRPWIHQCGSVEEARAAHAAGADAVIAQGVEAGGHVRGTIPAREILAAVRAALPDGYPVLAAGGIATAADVRDRLDAGAEAVVLGTRFVMSEESGAHPAYRARLADARETVLTELFGLGWPAPHRVVRNAAVERWLRGDPRGPRAVRALNRLTGRALAHAPARIQAATSARQSPRSPFLGPYPPSEGGPEGLLDAGALYAGETVARIDDVRPAGELVRELTPA
jgi:NAD(P)H-dependent flavin oxidoreductase YrpB (nitropropane dioxygenase family)